MKGMLVAAMIVAAAVGGVATPARAGAVGDAVVAVGTWVSGLEASVSAWIDQLMQRVAAPEREERAADAFRRLAVESPERIDSLAGRAGYVLSGYAIARGDSRDLMLRFRHERDLDSAERLSLARELQDPASLDLRPELTLLQILLDAADWRDAGSGGRYPLSGVEVQVDETVTSRLIFLEPAVEQ